MDPSSSVSLFQQLNIQDENTLWLIVTVMIFILTEQSWVLELKYCMLVQQHVTLGNQGDDSAPEWCDFEETVHHPKYLKKHTILCFSNGIKGIFYTNFGHKILYQTISYLSS